MRDHRTYREVFFAHNGPGPYPCFECGKDVLFAKVNVHHVDHDHENNHPSNLVAAHVGCHHRYHARADGALSQGREPGFVHSEETKRRISRARTGRPCTMTDEQKRESLKKAWATRREKYGSAGRSDGARKNQH